MKWWLWISSFHFIFHLHLQSPISLSSSFLFLPFREREEDEKWESELSWELHQLMIYSPLLCLWHVGPWASGGQLILHSLSLFCHLEDEPAGLTDCPVSLYLWGLDPNTYGLALGPINLISSGANLNIIHLGFEVTHLQWHGRSLSTYGSIHFTRWRIYQVLIHRDHCKCLVTSFANTQK